MSATRTPQGVEIVWERYLFDDDTHHCCVIDCGFKKWALWFDDIQELGEMLAEAVRHKSLPVYAAVVAQSRVAEWFGRYDAEEAAAQEPIAASPTWRPARTPGAALSDPPAPAGPGWVACPWLERGRRL
jgi:hypothetical protein